MPTRSYFFPSDFAHIGAILRAESEPTNQLISEQDHDFGLPPIPTPGMLSIVLGISPKIIFSIKLRKDKYYRVFSIPKKNGNLRYIEAPRTYLKVIQWWILDNILSKASLANCVFGFVKGRGPIDNAKEHFGAKHLLNVDLENFFPSITSTRASLAFQKLGYAKDVAEQFADLCSFEGRLPQGAPTSPAIANLVCAGLDTQLAELASKHRLTYSRYADDLTFSSEKRISLDVLSEIKEIVRDEGFSLNKSKTRFAGHGDQMEVTGVVINKVLQPSRTWRRRARAKIHQLSLKDRLIRKDLHYLHGIVAMRTSFDESAQVKELSSKAIGILSDRSGEVIGQSEKPKLPKGLTIRQAETLAGLRSTFSNAAIAQILGTTEDAVKKRLQIAFKKIGAQSRQEARIWSELNL